jgi:hypothetical protein
MLFLLLLPLIGAINLQQDLSFVEKSEGKSALSDYLTEVEAFLQREQRILEQGKVTLILRVITLYRADPTEEIRGRLSQLLRSHASEMRGIVGRFLRESIDKDSEMPQTLADLSLFLVGEDDSLFHNLLPLEARRLRKLLGRYHNVVDWGVEKRSLLGEVMTRVREAASIRSAMQKFSHRPVGDLLWRVEKLTSDPTLLRKIERYRLAKSTLEKDQLLKEIGPLWRGECLFKAK